MPGLVNNESVSETVSKRPGTGCRIEIITRRLHRRSLRRPTRRKWTQSGYLCTTPSTAHAEADAGISWS